jgi:peptide/nickel transport system permease protein
MPAVALALPQAGVLTRVTRSAVLETLHEDFTRTATRQGPVGEQGAVAAFGAECAGPGLHHSRPAVHLPVAGAVLVENVFNLPGLGRLAYQALSQRDIVVMQDVVLFFAGLVIVMNFLVDLSYLAIDPSPAERHLIWRPRLQ